MSSARPKSAHANRVQQSPFARRNFIARNEGFDCGNCGASVGSAPRTYRNHCPYCLFSKHVDEEVPGDRAATCTGLMEPTAIEVLSRTDGSYALIHTCRDCSKQSRNKMAADDDMNTAIELAKGE